MKKLNLITLNDNTPANPDVSAEWGLSILVETDNSKILFDAGYNSSSAKNADVLGVELGEINKIFLSHGHRDHAGGLRQVLRKMKKQVEIIAHPNIWGEAKYRHLEGRNIYVGIPFQRQELESLGATFNLSTKPVKITDDIMTSGEIPMVTNFEKVDPGLFVKGDTGWQPDQLIDEQALIINTQFGLVVITGCAHRGIINTLYCAQQITGVKVINTVVGGFHLLFSSKENIKLTIRALKELGVHRLGISHCTGFLATMLMAQVFGDKFFLNNGGTSIKLID
jgi:7,8-dihydropterin-6-yl-methyl-4-(beta-D-ribofuranosyl)aminobenzene 5'-phosphate synthase